MYRQMHKDPFPGGRSGEHVSKEPISNFEHVKIRDP